MKDSIIHTLVDTETGEIVFCRQMVRFVIARGNVFRVDGKGPRQMTDFPMDLVDYDLPIPNGLPGNFPDDWVSVDSAIGNSTNAHLEATGPTIQATNRNFKDFIDAALMRRSNGKIYFLKGNEYVRYSKVSEGVDEGYPQHIMGSWPGWVAWQLQRWY